MHSELKFDHLSLKFLYELIIFHAEKEFHLSIKMFNEQNSEAKSGATMEFYGMKEIPKY